MREARIRGPVAPTLDSHAVTRLADMTKVQLRALIDKAGIEMRVKATKGEMVEALEGTPT
jgi:hypothetical protein